MLCYLFGDYNRAAKVARRLDGKAMKRDSSSFSICAVTFFKGLANFAVSTQRGQWRARWKARRSMRQIQKWVKGRCKLCSYDDDTECRRSGPAQGSLA
mmetsp:Transcript_13187/g.19437  ORF Transcript_13187/g.19437 Transcript_13187/m.19437 type:complete len:98 (-) Transcript_13187:50-343(-)